MAKVGLYFYVNGQVIMEAVAVEEGAKYGEMITFEQAHINIWEKNYLNEYHHEYDYYPRGRVVYNPGDDRYILYIDPCIDDAGRARILMMFGIDEKKLKVVDDDFHYKCHRCNEFYYE